MSLRFLKKTTPLETGSPLIEPLTYHTERVPHPMGLIERLLPQGIMDHRLEDKDAFVKCYDAYQQELHTIATKMTRSNGKPIFHGLGLYPEMGADLAPLPFTGASGRLVSMSIHESELLAGCALLEASGQDIDSVFGKFKSSGKITRDLGAQEQNIPGDNLNPLLKRAGKSRKKIGRRIGEADWMNWGRHLNWEHFTFLPSASGDEKILAEYLNGNKFDYLILKGTYGHRFTILKGKDRGRELKTEYEDWLKKMDEKYLSKNAVILVAEDEPAVELLTKLGYKKLPDPEPAEYPPNAGGIWVNAGSRRNIAGAEIHKGITSASVFVNPKGRFTIMEKQQT